jgi:hypothetical protein
MRTITNLKTLLLMGSVLFATHIFCYSPPDFQTQCVTLNTDGYIVLKVWSPRKGNKYKLNQARKDAVKAVLFAGLGGGGNCTSQNPLLNSADERDKFHQIHKSFFSRNGDWLMYTNSSNVNYDAKGNRIYEISVSKEQLRKNLENQEIIKKLNHGF